MKKYFRIALLFLPLVIQAQQRDLFKIDSLPKEGLLLNKNWKYQLGDNPEFAEVYFDDSRWQSINPTVDIFDLPQLSKTGKIFWLRLRFQVDSSFNQQMLMTIKQSGASEVFMNGKLIQQLGVVSTNNAAIKAYNPDQRIFAFPIQSGNFQVIALRYAFQPNMRYATHFGASNVALAITLYSPEDWYKSNTSKRSASNLDVAVGSFYAVLCLLYLAFYLFFSKRKTSLYFSIFTVLYTIPPFVSGLSVNVDIGDRYWLSNTFIIMSIAANSFLLLSVYRLFDSKIGIFYWLIFTFGLASIGCSFLFYNWGWLTFGIGYNLLVGFEIFRIAIKGIIKHKSGAWIIASGGSIFFFFWFLFLFGSKLFGLQLEPYFYAVASVSIPLSVAIFLGYDFAQTNVSLQQKLEENEILFYEKQQILATQKDTLERQVEVRTSELKASQAQLIQSEKMASLGELTAGIAHEIQNPLNFVNNFSEVNKELIEEVKSQKSKLKSEELDELLNNIADNEEKINYHGKRADAIVKSMLQHSRASVGQKEPTDINALADEYLRLAYQGQRAKDKSFNVKLVTEFDPSLGKINIIPQDIGRVLLNLYSNAFYTVDEKKILRQARGDSYEPTVSIRTRKINGKVEIRVADNGNGVPQKVVDKIFQPFFTTKPTGQGTGLGLSLSYDIIKAHSGELKVESKEGEGSEFIVLLPS